MRFRGGMVQLFSCALAAAGVLAMASPALAVVKREGTWPATDPKVSLDVSRLPREEAIRKLCEAAGWSVVVHAPDADPVDIHVKDEPAGKVLDLLLLDADYVATRDGSLVSIRRAKSDSPAAKADDPKQAQPKGAEPKGRDPKDDDDDDDAKPPAPPAVPAVPAMPALPAIPAPPAPPALPGASADPGASAEPGVTHEHGRDLDVAGESVKIAKNQVVHDVSVMGGSVDVYGTVTGDIDVSGGQVRVRPGAHVLGDVSAMGGDIRIEDGGRIDGEVSVMGGSVRRGDKAIVGGDVQSSGRSHSGRGHGDGDRDRDRDRDDDRHDRDAKADDGGLRGNDTELALARSGGRFARSKAGEVGGAFARMAMLFVFGTMLLALQPERMDTLKAELVARPMRSFAMGVLGALGAAATLLILVVTVVGIPFAIVGALAGALALAASLCAVLETAGRALVRHKSQNPYVHLAIGCGLFLAVTAIPVLGHIVAIVVGLLATGILVSTRLAGLVQPKSARPGQPYRTAAI